jgi:poly(hydroxyalkanoate) depolymerase family esterase
MDRQSRQATQRAWTLLLVSAALSLTASPAWALTEVTGFGSNPGQLKMYRYVPASLHVPSPLVLLLHGCAQTAGSYDDETGWTKYADLWGFALVLAEQPSGMRCFTWWEPADIGRDSGEALSIKQMIDKMRADYPIEATRIYVSGLSAGGAMTEVMLAAYPDLFAGGAIVAGVPYECATSQLEATYPCMSPGKTQLPSMWGDLVRGAYPGYSGAWPTVSIWHGESDMTVNVVNATESMKQWTNVHGIDQNADVDEILQGVSHQVWQDVSGRSLVDMYLIPGMGHGQAIDPGTALAQCGTAGAYILSEGICAAYVMAKAWGLDRDNPQPADGAATNDGAPADGGHDDTDAGSRPGGDSEGPFDTEPPTVGGCGCRGAASGAPGSWVLVLMAVTGRCSRPKTKAVQGGRRRRRG